MNEKSKAEILSEEEIAELLGAINGENQERNFFHPKEDIRKIQIYDFKRPNKLKENQISMLLIMHKIFARLAASSLSERLCSTVHVIGTSVDQLTYEEFTRCIPAQTTFAVVGMDPLHGYAALEIDPKISFTIIDKICGGPGNEMESQRELTDIETSIMEDIVIQLLENIREAWIRVTDLRPRLDRIITNPQYFQIVSPTEMVILVTMEIKVGDVEGVINFCIPYCTIEPIIEKISPFYQYNTKHIPVIDSKIKDRKDIPIMLYAEILRRNYSVGEIYG